MLKIVFLIFLNLAPALVLADDVSGSVQIRSGKPYLVNSFADMNEIWLLIGTSPSITADLAKLKNGDLLMGTGSYDLKTRVATIESIDIVGLKALLGTWRTQDWHVFEFEDFTRLNLYVSDRSRQLKQLRQMNYTIAPETGKRWTIFMADNISVHVGSIELVGRRVRMTILNNETGQVSELIDLSPFSVR